MRITGGILRGRQLKVPSLSVRPTTDMVRQALFSIIGNRLTGARFLDLYAGSGAVGLEAWSRGAEFVRWVEADRRVFAILKDNVELLCGSSQGIVSGDAEGYLKRRLAEEPFDIIFADPPYEQTRSGDVCAVLLRALSAGGTLSKGGIFVLEQEANQPAGMAAGWRVEDERRYGRTKLTFLVETGDAE